MSVLILKKDEEQKWVKIDDIFIVQGYSILPKTRIFFKDNIKKCILFYNTDLDDITIAIKLYQTAKSLLHDTVKIIWLLYTRNSGLMKTNKTREILLYIKETHHHQFKLIEGEIGITNLDVIYDINIIKENILAIAKG